MHTFKIFVPVKKFYFTANTVIYPLAGFFFLPMAFELFVLRHEYEEITALSKICLWVSVMAGIVGFFFKIFRSSRKKPLLGRMEGNIVFSANDITVNNRVYTLTDIEKISFPCFDDYEGRKEDFRDTNYNGRISQGVDNKVILSLKNGQEVVVQFQLERRYEIREMRPELVHYHNEGKIHFLHLIDVLGIVDYNAIQIFKKSLTDGGAVKSY